MREVVFLIGIPIYFYLNDPCSVFAVPHDYAVVWWFHINPVSTIKPGQHETCELCNSFLQLCNNYKIKETHICVTIFIHYNLLLIRADGLVEAPVLRGLFIIHGA
jgi:hypothetical protein